MKVKDQTNKSFKNFSTSYIWSNGKEERREGEVTYLSCKPIHLVKPRLVGTA